jgi:hypothetical protein
MNALPRMPTAATTIPMAVAAFMTFFQIIGRTRPV